MKVLIFASRNDLSQKAAESIVNGFVNKNYAEVYFRLTSFLKRLHIPRGNLELILLLIGNHRDLESLIEYKDMLFDIPIILLLPDMEKMTMKQGLKLYPRYISCLNGSLDDVMDVLEKISAKNKAKMIEKLKNKLNKENWPWLKKR